MEDDEAALLHEPDLMLAILRAACQEPAGLDDALARLRAHLAVLHEPLPAEDEGDLRGGSNTRRCCSRPPTRSHRPAAAGSA